MRQRGNPPARRQLTAFFALALLSAFGCDEPTPAGPSAKRPTVASVSPAATDILVAIGAGDHLVAVSNYDTGKPAVARLPTAGDYLTVDWERLGRARPDVLILQAREASAPEGFKQRAATLGIRPVYIHIDTLADIYTTTRAIGDAVAEPAEAAAAEEALRARLDAVAKSVAGRPRVRALVVTSISGTGAAGPGTFIDDLLTIAGGDNAAAGEGSPYPRLDREKVVALAPEAVLHLLPEQPEPVIEQARRYWASMPDVPAVKDGRVYYLTGASVMHPGLKVGDVAEEFAAKLHPGRSPSPGPTTTTLPSAASVKFGTPVNADRPNCAPRHPERSERISSLGRREALARVQLRSFAALKDDGWGGRPTPPGALGSRPAWPAGAVDLAPRRGAFQ